VIRGIREIRGYDQPVGRSPGVTRVCFRRFRMMYVMRARAALGLLTLTWAAATACDQPLSPTATTKIVAVLPVGLTQIRLEFDTGIR